MILLGVNIDHCATLRQARYRDAAVDLGNTIEPDPVALAMRAEKCGANGITAHLREDRRHMQDADIWRLKKYCMTKLNLEMACTQPMIDLALELKPEAVCVVPEGRNEVTTEGGLDVIAGAEAIKACIDSMKKAGIETSLFIDADIKQIEMAAKLGAPTIELHTGAYALAYGTARRSMEFKRLALGAIRAHELGLKVNAGHGINYVNVDEVITIPHLYELNIGHSIMSRAMFTGIEEAVALMKARMNP
jgi:pyridoxine 5-phosphate synthase